MRGIRSLIIAFLFITGYAAAGRADHAAPVSARHLRSTVIFHNGRCMPLQTYARLMLVRLSGRSTAGKLSAVEWLADVLFADNHGARHEVFLVDRKELLDFMKIEHAGRRRFSFDHLRPGMGPLFSRVRNIGNHPHDEMTGFDREALRLSHNLEWYAAMRSSLDFCTPDMTIPVSDSGTAALLDKAPGICTISYLEVLAHAKAISSVIQTLTPDAAGSWSSRDSIAMMLDRYLYERAQSTGDQPLRIFPRPGPRGIEWTSPWEAIIADGRKALADPLIHSLRDALSSYRAGDRRRFGRSLQEVRARVDGFLTGREKRRLRVEQWYQSINPRSRARMLYGLAVLLSLCALAFPAAGWVLKAGMICTVTALVPHTFELCARMYIMGRPPVSTLYETFVFVAWAAAVLGLIAERLRVNGVGIFISALLGFGLLQYAGRYGADGGGMGMLAAVLNNNFWLSTHVITISLGYAGVCAAGVAGHVYCIRYMRHRAAGSSPDPLPRLIYGLLAFGLVFIAAGTMFGGMWADRAWGRFWGWDPKENGALLIILWCAILFHARAARLVSGWGFSLGAAAGTALVMIAWIGVNLLGVGMHAYGHTTNGALLLYGFLIAESLFIGTGVVMKLFIIKK